MIDVPELLVTRGAAGAEWRSRDGGHAFAKAIKVQAVDTTGAGDTFAGYFAAGRDKGMIFVGVDGLGGPDGGIKKVMDGVLACTFVYPPCAAEALDFAVKLLRGEQVPERVILDPAKVAPDNAAELYEQATVE